MVAKPEVGAEFELLGSVRIRAAGQSVTVGSPKQCVVLAALAIDADQLVPVDALIDRVWGPAPPDGARRSLHTYIARIRRLLEQVDGAPAPLLRQSDGYLLRVERDRVDLHRFRRLVDEARRAASPDPERARLLREALRLWRGEPLAGLPGEWVQRVRQGWQGQRLEAVVAWAQSELRLGSPSVVIAPLTELVAQHPLAEPLTAELMRALHASGRSAEALDRFAATRRRLVDELGTEPGAQLQGVHRSILRSGVETSPPAASTLTASAPTLAASNPVPPTPVAPATTVLTPLTAPPAQLPLDINGFTGRREDLDRLDGVLAAASEQPTAVVISALSGTAGVGKTALAVHWAHRVADRFPDGQLYLNLRGFDPGGAAMSPEGALRRLLQALGAPPERIPEAVDAQAAFYRTLLAGRRILVLLDNARDAEQVRPLLPGAPGCLALVTSRAQLASLVAAEGAQPLVLDLLPAADARRLLARRLGPDRVAAEPDAVEEIITLCARLPLALSIVTARAVTHPRYPLTVLAEELRRARGDLDVFSGEDPTTDVRSVFSWSYRTLSPATARLFRLLGVHTGPDVTAEAAASLGGVSVKQARPLLVGLTRAHLVTEHRPGRYLLHDLLRAYAAELARRVDPEPDRRAALRRLLDHYLHTAHTAARLMEPHRERIPLQPLPSAVATTGLADAGQAMAWFTTEHPNLLPAVGQAAASGLGTHAWQLAWVLTTYFQRGGHWHDQTAVQRIAVEAAAGQGDLSGEAHAHRGLARAHFRLGHYEAAECELRRALRLARRLGDRTGEARAYQSLGYVCGRRGWHGQALHHVERALALFRSANHRSGEAESLNGVAWCLGQLGDYPRAVTVAEQALALVATIGDPFTEASTWDSLGYARAHLGRHQQAITDYERALARFRELGDRYSEADVLAHLGDAHHMVDDPHRAHEAWRRSLAILEQLGHPDAAEVRTRLRSVGDPVR
ncbi:BTAD domain-containing putative transcriptional regulator [Micromonospora sp. NPDC049679]|uniref:AfsR/SARP family transcriptional regulator n=1 Tax=Micromonospora sp. NPDC049679 TaxID=3155920 RepID=UPI0033CFC962